MVFKNNKYKNSIGWGIRIYRSYLVPTGKFEALLIKLGKRGLWLFRNQLIENSWEKVNN